MNEKINALIEKVGLGKLFFIATLIIYLGIEGSRF